jgi:hypothetical protein
MAKKALRTHSYFISTKNRNSLTPLQFECYRAWQHFELHYDVRDEVPDAVADRLEFTRPEPPTDPRTIDGYKLPREKQKFQYYTKKEKQMWEERMLLDETDSRHQEFLDFISEEWRRRRDGYWFFNGGKLEYITGSHYMFLQYWMIPVAKDGRNRVSNADFRDVHRTLFYCLDVAKNDNRCYGLLYYSMRRIGKTIVATSHGFFDTTAHKQQKMTIQSKNEKDGKGVYLKLVESWKEIPSFFKPLDSEDSNPQSQLSFSQKKSKGAVSEREYSNAYLDSFIRHDSSKETALDGRAFSYIIQDEVGKCERPLDCNERWNVSKECLAVGTEIIGFAYVTSTIEDFEKFASKEAEELWDRSDAVNKINETTDRTESGLYRLFMPAYYGFQGKDKEGNSFVDEWGYSDIRMAHNYVQAQYDSLKGKNLLSYRRKYPLSIDDSFALTDSGNNFSKERLFAQKAYNKLLTKGLVRKGNFEWKGGVKNTEVVFYPDKDGRWEVSWMPPDNDRNKYEIRGTTRWATRDNGRMGVDPFDASYTRDEGSKGAAVTIIDHHTIGKGAVVCTYLHRQEYAENFFDDMVKQAVFYSTPVLIENNKTGLVEHFRREGWNGFALKDPLEKDARKRALPKRGIPTTNQDKIQEMLNSAQAFIYDFIGKNDVTGEHGWCPHDSLLDDCIRFEPDNRTKYDLTMALLMATTAYRNKEKKLKVKRQAKISDWFPVHK